MWVANSKTRNAFKVVRHVANRDVYRLRNAYGVEWEKSRIELERTGYSLVKARPAYAEPGDYSKRKGKSA